MDQPNFQFKRLLVVLPSWVGDVVMATPALRAIRQLYPEAHIACLAKDTVKPVIDACPWYDQLVVMHPKQKRSRGERVDRQGVLKLATHLRRNRFDAAVLMPNSFRSALLARTAGIPRRIGYDRDGRGFLLTDRLLPMRELGKFIPTSTLHYYLGIARYLGATDATQEMELFTRPEQDEQADQLLRKAGIEPGQGPLVLLNPGANYGGAKMWFPDRFAAVADQLIHQRRATVLVNGAPKEKPILDAVHKAARHRLIDLPSLGSDLSLLKSIVRRCHLMVTNDTGPRHIAAAFGVPVVTVFGPTDPRWSDIEFPRERTVRVEVFCGPCQKKVCPLDHRCMKLVEPEMVVNAAHELLEHSPGIGNQATS